MGCTSRLIGIAMREYDVLLASGQLRPKGHNLEATRIFLGYLLEDASTHLTEPQCSALEYDYGIWSALPLCRIIGNPPV